jgi:hypothetical protein
MKKLVLLLAVLVPNYFGTAHAAVPTVITQTISNDTASSAYLRANVNPNGTNGVAWFNYGTSSALGSSTTNYLIGVTNVGQSVSIQLNGLLAGTRYYYQAYGSNYSGVVAGTIENFVTTQVSYDFTGPGLTGLDVTRPYGSEPGSVWDDALRQTKAALVSFAEAEHNDDGTHKNSSIQTPYIANGAVTTPKLGVDVIALINSAVSNATAVIYVTNSMVYAYSTEYPGATPVTCVSLGNQIWSFSVASNTFTKTMVTTDTKFSNGTGANHNYSLTMLTNGFPTYLTNGPYLVKANSDMAIAASWIMNASQSTSTPFVISGIIDTTSTNSQLTIEPKTVRQFWIP